MTYDILLKWPAFNVDLNTVDAWLKANAGTNYCGLSANSGLQIHYSVDPGDYVRGEIAGYWASLSPSSDEAENYKSISQRTGEAALAKAALLASATAKLEALGLSSNEITAILGS